MFRATLIQILARQLYHTCHMLLETWTWITCTTHMYVWVIGIVDHPKLKTYSINEQMVLILYYKLLHLDMNGMRMYLAALIIGPVLLASQLPTRISRKRLKGVWSKGCLHRAFSWAYFQSKTQCVVHVDSSPKSSNPDTVYGTPFSHCWITF